MLYLLLVLLLPIISNCSEVESNKEWFKIEGKVQAPDSWVQSNGDWRLATQVLIDGGDYRAFLKYAESFSIMRVVIV